MKKGFRRFIVNMHDSDDYDVRVDRKTKWGNPHHVGYCAKCRTKHTRAEAIRLYRRHLARNLTLLGQLHTLRGKRLGCWCWPKDCHAYVLASLANLPRMTILITGDRKWNRETPMRRALAILPKGCTIVNGDATGADQMSSRLAWEYGHNVIRYPAKWYEHGRTAGPIRNSLMLSNHPEISLCLAFHDRIWESKGTKDMITKAKRKKIKTVLISNRIWIRPKETPHHAASRQTRVASRQRSTGSRQWVRATRPLATRTAARVRSSRRATSEDAHADS